MAVLRNRRPPRMHPACTDPLLRYFQNLHISLVRFRFFFWKVAGLQGSRFLVTYTKFSTKFSTYWGTAVFALLLVLVLKIQNHVLGFCLK